MASEKPAVTFTKDGAVGIVHLDRGHGNAIDDALLEGLVSVFAEAESNPEIGGVVLTAAGKIFCPGLDLQELLPLDRDAMERFMRRFSAAILSLYTFPKPIVAAIHGHALAGGCVLSLCADWRVLRRGAVIGLNEVKVGVPLPFGVALIVREGVPKHKLTEVALLGRNFSDEAAVEAGLAHELAEPDTVLTVARARLDELLSKDAFALAVTKKYLRSPVVERVRANNLLLLPEWLDGWFSKGTRVRIQTIVDELKSKGKAT